jgi:hypothetical protein
VSDVTHSIHGDAGLQVARECLAQAIVAAAVDAEYDRSDSLRQQRRRPRPRSLSKSAWLCMSMAWRDVQVRMSTVSRAQACARGEAARRAVPACPRLPSRLPAPSKDASVDKQDVSALSFGSRRQRQQQQH